MARLFLLMMLMLAAPLQAAEAPAKAPDVPILVVDIKRVLDESKASTSAQKQIEQRRSAFQSEIADKEKAIRADEQALLQLREKIKPAEYAEKENQLRAKFREVEKYVQDRRQLLEQATTTSMGTVREGVIKIVTDIAKKRGTHTVLIKQQVLWSEDALDITNEVLERLNAELPDVDVPLPPVKSEKTP